MGKSPNLLAGNDLGGAMKNIGKVLYCYHGRLGVIWVCRDKAGQYALWERNQGGKMALLDRDYGPGRLSEACDRAKQRAGM